jgi:hypothetical protein
MYSLVDPVGNGEMPPSKASADCMLPAPERSAQHKRPAAGLVRVWFHFCLLVSYLAWLVVSPLRRLVGARQNNGALHHRLAVPAFSRVFCEAVQRMSQA